MKLSPSLRGWLRRLPWDIILVYIVFNALVGVLARLSLAHIRDQMRQRSFDDLNSVATLKSRRITDWLQGLTLSASAMTHDELFAPGRPSAGAFSRDFLLFVQRLDPLQRFAAVALVDEKGRVLEAAPPELPAPPDALGAEVRRLPAAPFPQASDLFRPSAAGPYLVIVSPVTGIGALVLLMDARKELFPLLREWPTTNLTAETLLVRRQEDRVLYLNDLRFWKDAALNLSHPLQDPKQPAAEALRRDKGTMDGLDYRGERVLAAWRKVAGTSWSVVAKADAAEVERPVRELSRASTVLVIALGMASTLFLVLRLRQLGRHNRSEREALVSHYGYLARYANDIILLLDEKGRIVEVNDRAAEAYGYPRTELLSMSYRQLSGEPADLQPLDPGAGLMVESVHRRKHGTLFPVEASIRSIQVGIRLFTQCILRDISERKRAEAEKKRLEKQLSGVHRHEAIGRLAGGVAHDLNNALTAIQAYGELLKMKLPDGAGQSPAIEGILAAVARGAKVTHGLLAYSEQLRLAWEPVELNGLLASAKEALERTLGLGVHLELQVHHAPLVVHGDAELLLRALLHLSENARRAMPRGGRFTLLLEAIRGQLAEEAACLRVRDTGEGMSPEVQARLFEPFFTTQGFGLGAGLGLPMVFGIVRQHGGRIEVDSERGRGTEFRIFLPLAQAAHAG